MRYILRIFAKFFKSRRWMLLAILAFVAVINTMLLLYHSPEAQNLYVKSLTISKNGSLQVNIPGLLAPPIDFSGNLEVYPLLKHSEIKFLINPIKVCSQGPIELLVAVSSNAVNTERRKRTRESFNVGREKDANVRLVFFLGMFVNMKGFQRKIQSESARHGDIVQINAAESYQNLTFKSIAILQWSSRYCSKAKYILKQDDDVRLNTFHLIRALRQRSMLFDHFIVGNSKLLVEMPIRNELSKYYVSMKEFSDPYYPLFAHGPGYAFPQATGALLYQASLRTPFFRLEDVYITGLCAAKAGVPVFFDKRFVLNEDWGKDL